MLICYLFFGIWCFIALFHIKVGLHILNTFKNLWHEYKELVRFFGWAFLLLVLWVLFSSFFPETNSRIHYGIIKPQTQASVGLLRGLGYEADYALLKGQYQSSVTLNERSTVFIGDGCSGLELFVLFAGFILIMGGAWKQKAWFLPLGLLLILVLNILRISALALINYHWPRYLYFNHKYTFVVVVYGVIFILWVWWVRKYSHFKT